MIMLLLNNEKNDIKIFCKGLTNGTKLLSMPWYDGTDSAVCLECVNPQARRGPKFPILRLLNFTKLSYKPYYGKPKFFAIFKECFEPQ